jgi:hypothetical protein
MRYVIADAVGVEVDSSYPWDGSLLANSAIARRDPEGYQKCHSRIRVSHVKALEKSGCREVIDGVWISSSAFVSDEYGVRLSFPDKNTALIEAKQECNEWFMICLQVMLLQNGLTMVHAAAVCKDGVALLLPSWGGVGKTACVTKLVREHGWLLLGDDIVVMDARGDVLAFLKDFVIYSYHRPLFPDVFGKGKGPVSPTAANRLLSKAALIVKPVLRRAPGLLSFARRHNPQSKKVSPHDIFDESSLGARAKLDRVIWLERTAGGDDSVMKPLSAEKMASMTASVTILEVVGARLPDVCALMGCGLLDYHDFFVKTYSLMKQAYEASDLCQLDVPTSVPIQHVPDWLIEQIGGAEKRT